MQADLIADRAMQAGAAQKRSEFVQLVELVGTERPTAVLEIGTMSGGTLRAWCECAADDAAIVSVDLPNGRWGGGYPAEDADRLRSYARGDQEVHLIRGDSHDFAVKREAEYHRPFDFLFIDGDHTYEGVKQDFEDYSPLVCKGGLIALHDILHHPQVPECDVDRFWAEIRDDYETLEFTVDGEEREWGPWGGIGVVRW